ncbi:hypothetical protein KQ51_00138 [Candidatus Izimaplasma bacterium HR1]|jgi:hypothetical protein|uniref:hypothetical protein n=1 Tax=Candidatus Izimoplasma sp. HR1 TaxID=1541959 RepID=UPI0004F79F05|nr:hypothetical protein KQ51_00138 [Candidatus Izimaplasma bacterium HR1]
MRLVDLELFKSTRKRVSISNGLFFGLPVGVVLFLLTVSTGFFGAILFGLLSSGFVFGLIYILRELTHKGVERKRSKLIINGPHIDVRLKGEMGILEMLEDRIIFHPLTPGGAEKMFEVQVDEELYLAVGQIASTKIDGIRNHNVQEGFILLKTMPSGLPRQFVFYDIDDALNKVFEIIEGISKYTE